MANCGGNGNVAVTLLGGGCFFDPAKVKGVESIPEDKNLNFFGSAKFQINNNWQAYGTALYSKDENHFIIQPAPISSVFTYGPERRHSRHHHAAADERRSIRTPWPRPPESTGSPSTCAGARCRTAFGTPRTRNKGTQVVVGLKGTLADRWDTDFSYSYAEGKLTEEQLNDGFTLYSVLLPLLNSGNVNLFGDNTPDVLAQLRSANFIGEVISDKSTNKTFNAKISGDLFSVPAGTVAGAVGVDFRKEDARAVLGRRCSARATSRATAAASCRCPRAAT